MTALHILALAYIAAHVPVLWFLHAHEVFAHTFDNRAHQRGEGQNVRGFDQIHGSVE